MSDHAFALGTVRRYHELLSPLAARETQNAVLAALHADGFGIEPKVYTDDGWSVRFAEIGDDSASNWAGFALEVVPLLALVGVRRPFARCAVPVAAIDLPEGGSRLLVATVWGFRGDGGTVGLVAKRVTASVERAAAQLGADHRSAMTPIVTDSPVEGRRFKRLTGWTSKR
ncbi:hypothetical protein ACEXQD_06155 [Herbiconiux sp. P15]|uniref:hypothetical protein n=1 Tax=Herbiconiux liukaitaii TaxID=3342799 RepID=UPI0035BAD773